MVDVARAAMLRGFDMIGNPSSPHADGRAARAAIEAARDRIKTALGWDHHLIFTSGATEAAMIALARGRAAGSVIRSAVEHDAVRRAAPDAQVAPVQSNGLLAPEAFGALVHATPGAVVAVQHVNSETGVVQPIADILPVTDVIGGTLFVDCAQSAGKLPLLKADLIAISAHKLGGPPGIGALLVRDLATLVPSGGQEQGYRGGTENLPAILGFAAAVEQDPPGDDMPDWVRTQFENRIWLDGQIAAEGGCVICGPTRRSPLVASYRMPGRSAAAQLIGFDRAGISVSAGSACSSGSLKPSAVMEALALRSDEARTVIRVSFGRTTTRADVEAFATLWREMARAA